MMKDEDAHIVTPIPITTLGDSSRRAPACSIQLRLTAVVVNDGINSAGRDGEEESTPCLYLITSARTSYEVEAASVRL